jgi:hypothetical protein
VVADVLALRLMPKGEALNAVRIMKAKQARGKRFPQRRYLPRRQAQQVSQVVIGQWRGTDRIHPGQVLSIWVTAGQMPGPRQSTGSSGW